VTVEDNKIEEIICLMEVYMDDFVGLAQALTPNNSSNSPGQFYMEYIPSSLHWVHPMHKMTN